MSSRLCCSFLLTHILVLGTMVPAHAVEPDVNLALRKFDEGRKAFDAKDFAGALEAFQASYSLSPSPNSRLYAARCLRALGKVASAYTTFRFAAREAQDRLQSTGELRYGPTRDAATAEGNELERRVPRVTLVVPGDPPEGFAIKLNGAAVAREAWNVGVEIDPGTVLVEAAGPRVVTFSQTVVIAEGQQLRVPVRLDRVPTATLAFHFRTRPSGIAITLDGTPVDMATSSVAREVDVGEHAVEISAPGYRTQHWKKKLADASAAFVDVDLKAGSQSSQKLPTWIFFSIGGAGLASLAAGTGLAVHANDEQSGELKKNPYDRSASTRDSIRAQAIAADVLFVAGAVLGVSAAVVAFRTQWKPERPSVSLAVAPWFSPTTAGAGLHGRF